MPSPKSTTSIRGKVSKKSKQLFTRFEEAATRYETEKTAALAAVFSETPRPTTKP
jgi:hypothetical protein